MKRRDVLKYVALVTGSAISSPLLTSILTDSQYSSIPSNGNYKPNFFSEIEFNFLKSFTDTILPKTDSPSASEVGVPETIDTIVANVYPKADQKLFRDKFEIFMQDLSNKKFMTSGPEEKLSIIQNIEQNRGGLDKIFYLEMKQQTISWYLTSEEIGENYLNYLPVPGYWDPCITLEEAGGKAWAI